MLESSAPGRMSDAEFRMLTELLRSHCGLHFGPDSRFLLERRVERRLREHGLSSFTAYHYLVRSGPVGDGEMARLVDELTTNETYFFRERSQLRALVNEIIPELRVERPERPAAVWSAGCSSGEEPYSIVMLAREAGLVPGKDFRIYASDISRRMLQRAREGTYREPSFRETEPALRERYFEQRDGDWQLAEDVMKHVDLIHLNLLDRSKIALLGTLDVILCRNVIIYFDTETKRHVVQTFFDKLRPGGHLLLGHSESLIQYSTAFQLRHLSNDMVYRRPLPGRGGALWELGIGADGEEERAS